MIKIFMEGGRGGRWRERRVNSKRALEWGGGGGGGVIKESFRKHLEIGGGQRQKLFVSP